MSEPSSNFVAVTPPSPKPSPPLTSHDWAIVDHALEDVHLQELKAELSPEPPATFGAGGPMCVLATESLLLTTSLTECA